MRSISRCAVSFSVVVALAAGARADDSASEGRYEISAVVWGTSMAIKADTDEGSVSAHVPFSDLLDHLSGGLQMHARGDWGVWSADFDALYARLQGDKISKTVRLGPQGGIRIGAEVESQLDEWIVEMSGGRQIFELGSPFSRSPSDTRHVRGELYAGARYWSVDPKIEVQVNATKIRVGDRIQWADPLIGLRFDADLSPTVVFRVSGDVGGFNIGNYCSDFTWSQVTELSWAFGESWSAHFGYKFLDFHRDADGVNERVQVRGPFIAAGYRF